MSYPIIAGTSTSVEASVVTSHTVMMPAGLVAGNLILVTIRPGTSVVWSLPTGFTQIFQSDTNRTAVFKKVSVGGEISVVFTSDTAIVSNSCVYRIAGWDSSVAPVIAGTTGSDTAPDAPSVTSGFSPGTDTLWVTCFGARSGTGNTLTAFPANFTLSQLNNGSNGYSAMSAFTSSASSLNPDAATQAVTINWVAATVAVKGFNTTAPTFFGSNF